ncbi:MAG: pirin family protein [Pseudomonadota bacterium]
MSLRPVREIRKARPAMEGAGVELHRVFSHGEVEGVDPFLMMDDFSNDDPNKYVKGFPWHPHRGIETISIVLAGEVAHADSLGNSGILGPGDVQWMTAGRGILHQEMPAGDGRGRMHGFQLWANLPRELKMTAPRYQDVSGAEIPILSDDDQGTSIRVICGDHGGVRGPVDGVAADPRVLDISIPPGHRRSFRVEHERHAFAYIFAGSGRFSEASDPFGVLTEKELPDGTELKLRQTTGGRSLVLFDAGDEISVQAGEEGIRFLLVSGKPIREPVAWYGPIVMNTEAEIRQAIAELQNGSFIS